MEARLGWREFWPFYLEEHNERRNRIMHVVGTSLALVLIVVAISTQIWWLLLAALGTGYAFAWIGHAVFQRNRPATFRYPIKSFASDWRLWAMAVIGRLSKEFEKHEIATR